MSEQSTTTEAPTPTPAAVAAVAGQGAATNQQAEGDLGDAGKKAIQAERDARKAAEKAASDLQSQLDAIKAAQMSDLEKAQAEAAKNAEDAAAARAEALRWRIAAKHGISDEDAETFLTGSTEEALTKQAERLASLATAAPTTPKPDRTQGGTGAPAGGTTADLFAAAVGDAL